MTTDNKTSIVAALVSTISTSVARAELIGNVFQLLNHPATWRDAERIVDMVLAAQPAQAVGEKAVRYEWKLAGARARWSKCTAHEYANRQDGCDYRALGVIAPVPKTIPAVSQGEGSDVEEI